MECKGSSSCSRVRSSHIEFMCFFQVKLTLQQRDQQLEALQQEHLAVMQQLTSTQEALQAKEQSLGDLQTHYEELQARLEELQGEATSKEDTIRFLQNEKIVLEVALQAAKSSMEEFDQGAKRLEEGTEGTSEILEHLRQELAIKSSQVMLSSCYTSEPCVPQPCCPVCSWPFCTCR